MLGLSAALLVLGGCDDSDSDSGSEVETDAAGTSSSPPAGSTTDEPDPSGPTSDDPSSTSDASTRGGSASSGGSTGEEDSSDSTGSQDASSTDSTGSAGSDVVGFAEIQVDLENMGGAVGNYASCTDGVPCHNNPDRNVHIVSDPSPAQLLQNWENIVNAPGTPWITPLDDSAQMLNEVPIPDDVRARWLTWIQAGAPFEAP